jgi:putative phosphoribosyl transferase
MNDLRRFADRTEAGAALAVSLGTLRDQNVVVLGLPRGGVPVAFEIATALDAPLDVIVVRKIGAPGQPELAMGAIGEDGVRVVNDDIVRLVGASESDFERVEQQQREELRRRAERFRAVASRVELTGRTAVIVDDGIATGSTARAACQVARAHGARRVVLAVPVAAPESVAVLADTADEIVCVIQPPHLRSVGEWYGDFTQVDDQTVVDLLARARRDPSS